MCYLTECPNCKKTTYGGCGKHLDGLFNDVKAEDLCKCNSGKPMKAE
ncbi:Conserved_hypothetical protein [Hexamita inflata]|uniref:Uncharacterized protein n=1 Tax=Hexamita inflata TaxID=28002 RepID=A0AA86TEU5_9EUKA|nr:Conserved hypothetical protein [Hexamita inflata]CAI9955707.1 Conserved hypothetical protein [Hexamita inflata]